MLPSSNRCLNPFPGDPIAAAACQVGERPPPLADAGRLLSEIEQEFVDAVVGLSELPGQFGEPLARRTREVAVHGGIRLVPERIDQ